LNHLFEFLMS